jgi:hypothetical protein
MRDVEWLGYEIWNVFPNKHVGVKVRSLDLFR